jgi:hypothetical protein
MIKLLNYEDKILPDRRYGIHRTLTKTRFVERFFIKKAFFIWQSNMRNFIDGTKIWLITN